jgi:uncharacterized repeat protein (TIGR01451 family)
MAVDFSIVKTGETGGPALRTVRPGDLVTYEIFIFNNIGMVANDVTVTDILPTELTNVTVLSETLLGIVGSNIFSDGEYGSIVGGTAFVDDGLTLNELAGVIYHIEATVDTDVIDGQTIFNTATVDAAMAAAPVDAIDSSFVVNIPADLAVTKAPFSEPGSIEVLQGGLVEYTIFATNEGGSPAISASVEDIFPAELDPGTVTMVVTDNPNVDGENDGVLVGGTAFVDDGLSIPVGETLTYVVSGTVDAGAAFDTTLSNIANVGTSAEGAEAETDLADNSFTNEVYFISTDVDITVEKSAQEGGTVLPGEFVTYQIEVANNGLQTAENVSIFDDLPPELLNVQWTIFGAGGVEVDSGTGDINATGLTIDSAETLTAVVSAQVDCDLSSGTIHNTATAFDAVVTDENPLDNTSDDSSFSLATNSPSVFQFGNQLLGIGMNNELIIGDGTDQIINGNFGDDSLFGSGGTDNINGGFGNDLLVGGSGNDFLDGGIGNDTLDGACTSLGIDQVDRLSGGVGSDLFVLGNVIATFYLGNGDLDFAYITDFNPMVDSLQLNGAAGDYTTMQTNVLLNNINISGQGIFQGGDLVAILQQSSVVLADQIFV